MLIYINTNVCLLQAFEAEDSNPPGAAQNSGCVRRHSESFQTDNNFQQVNQSFK